MNIQYLSNPGKYRVLAVMLTALCIAEPIAAKTVKVSMTAKENTVVIDNKGTEYPAWTYDGKIPGPVVRVTEGDTVDFTLTNPDTNKESHSMDFHAAVVDVLKEFSEVKPGESKQFSFVAKHPGVFMYHCGAATMAQHIARGMYGIIIVDPKEGYSKNYPKPDREYVLIQSQYFPNAKDKDAMIENRGWAGSLINGKIFHYDPVHDEDASLTLQSKPGERVRIFFVNANINNPVAFHPIAGIWDRVYINGNPKNVLEGVQTYNVSVATADTFDLVSPADHPTNNAIVDHTMSAAMRGAITVLMNMPDADPELGKGNNILIR
ncbi:multicopper oxidase domain-containing protein [Methylomarinum sp. Ch1-1]|uniref:Copper-containing nitrite reductase n=1 Tax=Methylomarinum roseum TaxID=3067653 RepID=A0AAU7NRL3_9GAMM|nr:multicopper oxidase domain-containing protein [Methylomarinum sp. Ch1-1]MDP4520740.1 multicopper oxidase domain-containing protein [Methylomarinum sp. Ch1-1]